MREYSQATEFLSASHIVGKLYHSKQNSVHLCIFRPVKIVINKEGNFLIEAEKLQARGSVEFALNDIAFKGTYLECREYLGLPEPEKGAFDATRDDYSQLVTQ